MKEQIFRLCKRLKKCTLNDLVQLLEVEGAIIQTALLALEQENLIVINNDIIGILNTKPVKKIDRKQLHLMSQYINDENFELILKGFCLNIPPQKVCHLVGVCKNCICDYYAIFRKLIYERQFKILLEHFFKKPQEGRYRVFHKKHAFFYVYQNQTFVSEKLLRAKLESKFKKDELKEFKRMYCYLARIEKHYENEIHMYHRLAESIWRSNKTFDSLYCDLKNNLVA